MPAALTSTRTSPDPGTGRGTSSTFRTSIPPYASNCTALGMKHAQVLRPRPGLEVPEGDVGELAMEHRAIRRIADAVEPFVHPGVTRSHALADGIERNLVIRDGAAGHAREDRNDVIPRQLVAHEFESL